MPCVSFPPPRENVYLSLQASTDDVALAFCRAGYVCPSETWLASGDNESSALILDCMRALGLVTCATIRYAPEIVCLALKSYDSALSRLNAALTSPQFASNDQTLLAVMIVTNIETIISDKQRSFLGWTAHVSGCIKLLRLRGKSALRTEEGQHLFFQACLNIISHCFQSASRVPPSLMNLIALQEQHIPLNSHSRTIWHILTARALLANLHSDFLHKQTTDACTAVGKALSMDQLLLHLSDDTLQLRSHQLDAPTWEAFIEHYLVTVGHAALLFIRLMLHLMILALAKDSTSVQAEFSDQTSCSRGVICGLRMEILSVVVHQAELVEQEVQYHSTGPPSCYMLLLAQIGVTNAAFAQADETVVRTLAAADFNVLKAPQAPVLRLSRGYNIIWALFLVGGLGTINSLERRRASDLLRHLGKSFDIIQAFTLADRLDIKDLQEEDSVTGP